MNSLNPHNKLKELTNLQRLDLIANGINPNSERELDHYKEVLPSVIADRPVLSIEGMG